MSTVTQAVKNNTEATISALNGSALVDLYNQLMPNAPVKRFATKVDGVRRTVGAWKAASEKLDEGYKKTAKRLVAESGLFPEDTDVVDVPRPAKVATARKVAKKTGAAKTGMTCAARIKSLVVEGLENDEIWKIVQKEYKLSDDKRHYPAWYRRDLIKKGR